MFDRRGFVSGAIYATIALAATRSYADAPQAPKIPLKFLKRIDYPGDDHVCVLVEVDLEPHEHVPLHKHPGVESSYLVSGGLTVAVRGQPDLLVKAGDGYQIPPETPHSVQNGPEKSTIVSTLIVEKAKPLLTLVPE